MCSLVYPAPSLHLVKDINIAINYKQLLSASLNLWGS